VDAVLLTFCDYDDSLCDREKDRNTCVLVRYSILFKASSTDYEALSVCAGLTVNWSVGTCPPLPPGSVAVAIVRRWCWCQWRTEPQDLRDRGGRLCCLYTARWTSTQIRFVWLCVLQIIDRIMCVRVSRITARSSQPTPTDGALTVVYHARHIMGFYELNSLQRIRFTCSTSDASCFYFI